MFVEIACPPDATVMKSAWLQLIDAISQCKPFLIMNYILQKKVITVQHAH